MSEATLLNVRTGPDEPWMPVPAIVGPQGIPGQDGQDGQDGIDGVTFTPSVDASGNISWTNDGGRQNPETRNIRGPQGIQGEEGYTPVKGVDYFTDAEVQEITEDAAEAAAETAAAAVMEEVEPEISEINGKIPAQATEQNQLADKAFVNSSVQTATSNFRGNWNTWSAVPTDATLYPTDYSGVKTPSTNDYLVVVDASGYSGSTLGGTWRFKYAGVWATNGKNGWHPEYQVNETPMTAAQLAALNSNITDAKRQGYDTHVADADIHVTAAQKMAWNNKMDKVNPTGSGYMTLGTRAAGSINGELSLSVGDGNVASGERAMAVGHQVTASGQGSFAHGANAAASGRYSFVHGTKISNNYPDPEASGDGSAALGGSAIASGMYSFAAGYNPEASGNFGFAHGYKSKAVGNVSHAEGGFTEAEGFAAHAEGYYTKASGDYQHVFGIANVEDTDGDYLEVVGNGYADETNGVTQASNARTLDWDGNERLHGDLYVGCNDDSSGGSKAVSLSALAALAETWTFTLEDGTTVSKKVVVLP